MSFGTAASGRPRRPAAGRPCVCGSERAIEACCGPVLDGSPAPTAEALMRSRYSAFALGDERHLLVSWHPSTRPRHLDLDPATRWTGLDVLTASGGPDDERGVVEFRARWRHGDEEGEIHERSRFVRSRSRWVYLDGEADDTSV